MAETSECIEELKEHISALEQGSMDVRALQKLALLCRENPVRESVSPTSPAHAAPLSPSPLFGTLHSLPSVLRADIWTQDKNFDRLFGALIKFLDPGRVSDCWNGHRISLLIAPLRDGLIRPRRN